MNSPKVLPTFAVVPSFTAMLQVCGKLGANMAMVVHGEQSIRLHRPIAPNGTLQTVAVVTGVYDKGKGAVAVVEASRRRRGHPVFDNIFSIFVRGSRRRVAIEAPKTVTVEPPDRAPDLQSPSARRRSKPRCTGSAAISILCTFHRRWHKLSALNGRFCTACARTASLAVRLCARSAVATLVNCAASPGALLGPSVARR